MAETEQQEGAGLQRTEPIVVNPSADGIANRVISMVSTMWQKVMAMPAGKRTWLLASAAFIAAMCVTMIWYAGRRDWKTLFAGLDGKDVQQVSQELAAAGIPYQMT